MEIDGIQYYPCPHCAGSGKIDVTAEKNRCPHCSGIINTYPKENPALEMVCVALGWQGGTIHQVIDEIKRLKEEAWGVKSFTVDEVVTVLMQKSLKMPGATFEELLQECKRLKVFEPKEGWTGRQCPQCLGTGEVHHEVVGHEKCSACGGTGDEYGMVCGCCKPKVKNADKLQGL